MPATHTFDLTRIRVPTHVVEGEEEVESIILTVRGPKSRYPTHIATLCQKAEGWTRKEPIWDVVFPYPAEADEADWSPLRDLGAIVTVPSEEKHCSDEDEAWWDWFIDTFVPNQIATDNSPTTEPTPEPEPEPEPEPDTPEDTEHQHEIADGQADPDPYEGVPLTREEELTGHTRKDLRAYAKDLGLTGYGKLDKAALVEAILTAEASASLAHQSLEADADSEIGGSIEGAGEGVEASIDGDEDEPQYSIDGEVVVNNIEDEEPEPEADAEMFYVRGCRRPDKVDGFAVGRVMTSIKKHRRKDWGDCEYRVECLSGGRFKLVYFKGGRDDMPVGTVWKNSSAMFRALLAKPDIVHHRQTLKRWFGAGGA